MQNNNSNGSHAASTRGFMALFAVMLAMGLGLATLPAEAAPFAYVTNNGRNAGTVSVIDTATNTVVATIPVGSFPYGVAVVPDGKHAYVANSASGTVSVIDTASNMVVATVPVGLQPDGVAVAPDGTHAYVSNAASSNISVIDTATNMVVATVPVGKDPIAAVAVTPDGKHAYAANHDDGTVSLIDTARNRVAATIPVGTTPVAVAVTPDGKHAYVANSGGTVSVIDANNTVTTTIPVGGAPIGIAVTPDGERAYVASGVDIGSVSVIDTASNTVVGTPIPLRGGPFGVAITPDGRHAYLGYDYGVFFCIPMLGCFSYSQGAVAVIDTASNTVMTTVLVAARDTIPAGTFSTGGVGIIPDVPFLVFSAAVEIHLAGKPNQDAFAIESGFTLSSTAPAINPVSQPVTLQVGTFAVTIPPGSFKKFGNGVFVFVGVVNGVRLEALIAPTGTLRYAFLAAAEDASLAGTTNPVAVRLNIGSDMGATSVTATITH